MKRCIVLMMAGLILSAGVAQGVIVGEYDYTSASGPDPTDQGWTYATNATNAFLGGYDASVYDGQSGWRVVDGTSTGFANYQIDLTAEEADLMGLGWSATWTFKLDSTAWKNDGSGQVADYYLPPNQGRQNDNGLWIETAGEDGYRYYLRATADENGNLAINDESADLHVLTAGGGNNGYDTEYTVTIVYDGTDAVLSYGGNDFALNKLGTMGNDRVLFGAHSSTGQGSVTYQHVSFDAVPEPATMVLLGFGGMLLHRRRRG